MYVAVGTRSLPKISAVCTAFSQYPELCFAREDALHFVILPEKMRSDESSAADPVSGVSRNPLTMESTLEGAKNRAKAAYDHCLSAYGSCAYGVGLEAGIFPVFGTQTGYMDVSMCAVFDGENYTVGGSPLFEYPQAVTDRLLKGEEAGLIADFFGDAAKGREGVIAPLTGGRVCRDEFDRYAVVMALSKIVSSRLYNRK
ncbi:MAG: DUF84 family protein [Clostridia bacterium]|nr:DUF84 family protein [Clostridia bacterium]